MVVRSKLKYFISVDWGTSNLRASLCLISDGKIIASVVSDYGIGFLHARRNSDQSKAEYQYVLLSTLSKELNNLKKKSKKATKNLPIIISGMASSSLGIVNLEYGDLPTTINAKGLIVHKFMLEGFSKSICLVSGLKTQDDVMRGEETQIVGLARQFDIGDAVVLIPGTHSKHVKIVEGKIIDFTTYMTGELFNLLSTESILSNSIEVCENWEEKEMIAFKEGVNDAKNHLLFKNLFKIRSKDILNNTDKCINYHYLSGLLVGSELVGNDFISCKNVYIIASEVLHSRYKLALSILAPDVKIKEIGSIEATALGHLNILFPK